jgi:hypothetical protein
MKAERKRKGIAAKNVTAASFHPNMKDIMTHPMTLNTEMRGKTPVGPKSSWICLGSVDSRAPRLPDAFSSRSKNETDSLTRLEK